MSDIKRTVTTSSSAGPQADFQAAVSVITTIGYSYVDPTHPGHDYLSDGDTPRTSDDDTPRIGVGRVVGWIRNLTR